MPLHVSLSLIKIRWDSITNWCVGAAMSDAKLLLLFIIDFCRSSQELLLATAFAAVVSFRGGNASAGAVAG